MNSLDTFEKRLSDETAKVEQDIESHKRQLEALNKRLEGLKRAAELFESEQGTISELLQTGTRNGGVIPWGIRAPVQKEQKAISGPKPTGAQTRAHPTVRSAARR